MTVSKEVQLAVDEIHRERDALAAAAKANELQTSQLADLKSQIEALKAGDRLSEEDKKALLDAVNEAGETNAELADAVPANVDASAPAPDAPAQAVPPPSDPDAPRPDPIAGTGLNGPVPLMPNSAFDPAGGVKHPASSDSGQPNQPAAIETAGGFVIAGGGSVQRAPGSRPESPSSTLVVPDDPNAKAPASTADEAKSGLGDSGQNALLGNDGQPASSGPGVVGAPREQGKPDPAATDSGTDAAQANRGVDPGTLEGLQEQAKGVRDNAATDPGALEGNGQPRVNGEGNPNASPAS